MKIFHYKEDRWPIAIILMLTTLDFILYFTVENIAVLIPYYLVMIIPKALISSWNHHHQHHMTLRQSALNRILEFFYALHTGVTTHLWRLHHVLGHHKNFLDQSKDESRWKRKDGTNMGVIEYSFSVALTAYPRGFKVGRKYPKQLRLFLVCSIITVLIVGVMVWFKPTSAIFLFVLPMLTSLYITAYVTYDHHAGLDTDNQFEASYNNLNRWFNRLTGNLGYHTAHHYKCGVHWSKLPSLHNTIGDKIPDHLKQRTLVTHRARTQGSH